MQKECSFRSFFLGGFECSTHRLRSGRRLDLIDSTRHDVYAETDYRRLRDLGVRTVRDGVRWHLVESRPYQYEFSSVIPMIRAAQRAEMQIIWDVFHYGWPDDVDIFSPEFIRRFSAFAKAFARVLTEESGEIPYFCPINEISFVAWGGGETGYLNPFAIHRGHELKRQLVRAAIHAIEAIRDVAPYARFVQVDPLIHVVTDPGASADEVEQAHGYNRAVFDGWAMLAGQLNPELGGGPQYLDIIGANYYVHNQWVNKGRFIERTDPRYKPMWILLQQLHDRFQRPIFLAETGIEDERRPAWLSYICDEVAEAMRHGVPMEGICIYPILNHPGWDDDRHCHNGLWDYCNDSGHREIYKPLADELRRQQARFKLISGPCVRERHIEAFV